MTLTAPAPIKTWFGVGGGADLFAEPTTERELSALLAEHPDARILGDGANLLVDDAGVAELVVRLRGELAAWQIDERSGVVRVGAGASLPKLIHATVREGLAGLHTLGGVPATVGGAVVMNAGGRFGEIAEVVETVRALKRDGTPVELRRDEIGFDYRTSGLNGLVVTGVDLRLTPEQSTDDLRGTLKEIMAHKKASQPLAAPSCGCVFRNPSLPRDMEGFGVAGDRVSAGLLIDRAGGKGLTPASGAVRVSEVHANFFETGPDATARDIIELIDRVRELVARAFGVKLETELVIWRRTAAHAGDARSARTRP
ncbi:MAG: UDP-N-acetylmuramate dehydrogenase [Planctomycetota bacterium]